MAPKRNKGAFGKSGAGGGGGGGGGGGASGSAPPLPPHPAAASGAALAALPLAPSAAPQPGELIPLPRRPSLGTLGKSIKLYSNHFALEGALPAAVVRYHVEVVPPARQPPRGGGAPPPARALPSALCRCVRERRRKWARARVTLQR
jgi:hypothetical protein